MAPNMQQLASPLLLDVCFDHHGYQYTWLEQLLEKPWHLSQIMLKTGKMK